jgi:hypothetical protein
MSMSTQHGGGGTRRPSSTKPGGKPKDAPVEKPGSAAKPAAAKAGAAKAGPAKGARPGAAKGGKGGGRKPITPVKVNQGRNWGPIILFSLVGILSLGIVGFGGYQVYQNGISWADRAAKISGIQDFRKSNPKMLDYQQHQNGKISYPMAPPVGGTHNANWQRCLGDVYNAPIASEHAVHSMEHGAVWITYNPDKVDAAGIDTLKQKVEGKQQTLMSPYPGLTSAISLESWGHRLNLDSADDKRVNQFLTALRANPYTYPEVGASCSNPSFDANNPLPFDPTPPGPDAVPMDGKGLSQDQTELSGSGMPGLPGGIPGIPGVPGQPGVPGLPGAELPTQPAPGQPQPPAGQ